MKKANLFTLVILLALRTPAEDAHGHDTPKATKPEERFTVACEHKIPQYTCDECRYELGLVKLDPSILRSASNTNGLVAVQPAALRMAQALLPMNGEIALNESSLFHLSSRVPGVIRSVRVERGAVVRAGDVLVEIESAELGRAVGAYRKNRALAELAKRNLEREKACAAQKLSPAADLVDAQMKYDEYRIELEAAATELAAMGLDEKAIRAATADDRAGKPGALQIRAPRAGTVIEKHASAGEVVEPNRELMTVADLSTVWVWVSLYERDLARFLEESKRGAVRVQVSTQAFPDRTFEGTVDSVGATVDESDRTIKVRVVLKNPDGLLRPGMFCAATAVFESAERVLAVPKNACLADEGRHFVFRLVRDGFALRTDVEVGRVFADSVEIVRGLKEGEPVVVEGAFVLKSDVLRAKMGAGCAD